MYIMKLFSITYHRLLHWFFAITILFGFGGYSNYTSPKSKDITTEQLAPTQVHTKKSVFYQNLLKKKWDSGSIDTNESLICIEVYHSRLTRTTSKNQSIFIFSSEKRHITSMHISSYAEEDSFHFAIG